MMRSRIMICVLMFVVMVNSACASTETKGLWGNELYDKVKNASAEILVNGRLGGSGWFASEDGYVVTAGHVIWGHDDLVVVDGKGVRYDAKLVAVDRGHDLALLKVELGVKKVSYLKIADKGLSVGSRGYLFGAPMFRHHVMITGYVARRETSYEYFFNEQQYVRVYHFAASSPSGTSGGCWVNGEGDVIGNQSGLINNGSGAPVGIASVAPKAAIKRLLEKKKSARTATLGMAAEELVEKSVGFIKKFPRGAKGIVPTRFHDKSGVKDAGLTDKMLITHIDGVAVQYRDELIGAVRKKKPGEKVKLRVLVAENHEVKAFEVTLGRLEATKEKKKD